MKISKLHIATLVISLALYIFIWNKWNIDYIRSNSLKDKNYSSWSLAYNSTIFSIDNYWYTSQIKNYLKTRSFTVDPHIYRYDVRRTPVYPLFYGFHYILFGESGSYQYIRYTQVFIFLLATVCLFFATYNFTGSTIIAWLAALAYGFNPTLVTYLFYTITEALSPSLVCFLLFLLSLAYKEPKRRYWIVAGAMFALATLCRPSIVLISIAIAYLIIHINIKRPLRILLTGFYFSAGAALFFAPHLIRNYIITDGEIIVLEKYYGDPMNYGMPNIHLRKWISCWTNPADYSSEVISNKMINQIAVSNSDKDKQQLISTLMQQLPERALIANNKSDITAAYNALYDYYRAKQQKLPTTNTIGNNAISKLEKLEKNIKHKAPEQVYIFTPLLFVKSIIVQSNSYPIPILSDYQGKRLLIIIKGIMLLFNIYLFISIFMGSFFIKNQRMIMIFSSLYVLTSFTYIIFILHYFEARYLIPIFPVLYITGAIYGYHIAKRISLKITPPDNA